VDGVCAALEDGSCRRESTLVDVVATLAALASDSKRPERLLFCSAAAVVEADRLRSESEIKGACWSSWRLLLPVSPVLLPPPPSGNDDDDDISRLCGLHNSLLHTHQRSECRHNASWTEQKMNFDYMLMSETAFETEICFFMHWT
jgi:hypothetical protein